MKKLIILLSVIFIGCGLCYAQGNNMPNTVKPEGLETSISLANQARDSMYRAEIDQLRKEVEALGKKDESLDKPFPENLRSWDKITLLVLCLLVLILFIMHIVDKKKRREEFINLLIGEKKDKSQRIQKWVDSIIWKTAEEFASKNQANVPKAGLADNDLKNVIKDLRQRIADLENKINRKEQQTITDSKPVETKVPEITVNIPTPINLYADSISGGAFYKVTEQPDADTVYELLLNSPTDRFATFTVYPGAYRRVLNNADFLDGSEKQRVNNSPTGLEVEEGRAALQDDGKWQITQKAKVKFV